MKKIFAVIALLICFAHSLQAQVRKWTVRVEEPTGIERRDKEIVRVHLQTMGNEMLADGLRVVDSQGREVPAQIHASPIMASGVVRTEILFPVTLIPGQLPEYTFIYSPELREKRNENQHGGAYQTDIVARRIGTSRFEIANSRFQILINLGKDNTTPAIVEAYNKTAGDARRVNLVETSPDLQEPLAFGVRSNGWGTALSSGQKKGNGVQEAGNKAEFGEQEKRTAGFTEIQIIEAGPLRARVQMRGAKFGNRAEIWEFEWYANSPTLIWRTHIDAKNTGAQTNAVASDEKNITGETKDKEQGTKDAYGFFFSAISATPYVPFTHWIVGKEVGWPDGWETDNPPHQLITQANLFAAQNVLEDLPGGQVLYYNPKENYGALSFFDLDGSLKWTGIGSRQFYAAKNFNDATKPNQRGIAEIKREEILQDERNWSSQIGLCFPNWKGTETLLNARSDYRRFAQPVMARVVDSQTVSALPKFTKAEREAVYQIKEEPFTKDLSVVTIAAANSAALTHDSLSLDGAWRLQHAEKGVGENKRFYQASFDDSKWQTVQVPGAVHTQILQYPAYYTHEAEWISFKEWWYRKNFRVPLAMKGKRIRLQFDATDYYADIYLNGKLLGRHEGYIDPYEFDVADKLNFADENQLTVRVWTPVDYYWRHKPYTVKGSYGAVDQKPDDITPLGITRSVRLKAFGAVKIDSVTTRPMLNKDGSADIDVTIALDSQAANLENALLELRLAPRNFADDKQLVASIALKASDNLRSVKVRFHLDKPQLWWTWDHGKPNLYTLTTRVKAGDKISDERRQALGIREIEKVDWNFFINGRRMFIRGTNSYYLELFLSLMNRQKYERDLNLMKSLNINMIRLHCHFQNPEFYDLCDELGLLVWQDYLEAWYPEDTDFALKAARLYDPHIRYVQNHPSIAIWATSDEESLENYRVLTKHLAGRVAALDVEGRPVVRSTGRYGDGHVYEGWYGGTIWAYTKSEEKFISELGATALPNYETLMEFLPNHWPIEKHQEEWIFRKLQIFEAMRAWGKPDGKTLQEYIPQTQSYVARLHQLAIERMRRRKYEAGGILHFHAIDFWPSVTMAAMDYFRRPTKSFYAVQRSFQMVLPSLEYDRDVWKVGEDFQCGLWIINDHWFEIPAASIKWRIVDLQGKPYASGLVMLDIAEDSSKKLQDLKWKPETAGKYELRAEVFDKQGKRLSENLYEFEVK
jgi:beta-mannosidase